MYSWNKTRYNSLVAKVTKCNSPFEVSTPVPKTYPTEKVSQLRNISGLLNFDKIMEKLLAELIISDMADQLDPAQYGNQ